MPRSSWFILLGGLLVASCSTSRVVRIPVETRMESRELPPPAMVTGVRVAVVRPRIVNDPDHHVEFTAVQAESYPTRSHQAHAVPQALTEVGFDVVEVLDREEAAAIHADYVLDLAEPEVSAFHPAAGSRTTIVGSAYDIRVRYRAVLLGADARPRGVLVGFGQETRRFRFMEPLFREAVVGAAVSLATVGASLFALILVAQLGLLGAVADGGDVFGACGTSGFIHSNVPDRLRAGPLGDGVLLPAGEYSYTTNDLCLAVANYSLYFAYTLALSVATSVAAGLAGELGGNAADVFIAGMHLSTVDPAWRGMVQSAHDEAARSMADDLASRVLAVKAQLPTPEALPAFAPPATPAEPAVPPAPPPATPAPPAAATAAPAPPPTPPAPSAGQ